MYYERPDTTKNTPVISIPMIFVSVLHICVTTLVIYVTGLDEIGYPSTILNPIVYFTSFIVVMNIIVGLKNKSSGYLDMILAFIILTATYFSIT